MNAQSYAPPPVKPKRKNNTAIIIAIVVVLLLCCCCVAAAAFVYFDPLKLPFIGTAKIAIGLVTGRGDTTAQAMPENTGVFVGLNLVNLTPEKIDRIVQPFANALNQDSQNTTDIMDQFEQDVLVDLDMTIQDDITPWIGQYAGIGLTSFQVDEYGSPQNVGFVLAVESRDPAAADAFLQKLVAGIESQSGATFSEDTYKEVTIYSQETQSETDQPISFCRSGNMVMASMAPEDLEAAIDAQKGGASMSKDPAYQEVLKQLPKERAATFYVSGTQYKTLFEGLLTSMDTSYGGLSQGYYDYALENIDMLNGAAFSVAIVDAGLQMDMIASYNLDAMTAEQKAGMESWKGQATKMPGLLPEDTLFYYGGWMAQDAWSNTRDMLIQMTGATADEFDQSMESFAQLYGFNPDTDLLPYLAGEMGMAIFPSSEGLVAEQGQINLGFALMLQTNDVGAMEGTLDDFSTYLLDQGTPVDSFDVNGMTVYELGDSSTGVFAAYGIGQEYLTIASSSGAFEDLFTDKASLAANARYKQVTGVLPGGMMPMLYTDVAGILDTIRNDMPADSLSSFEDSISVLNPIPNLVMGYAPMKGNILRMSLVVFIEQ